MTDNPTDDAPETAPETAPKTPNADAARDWVVNSVPSVVNRGVFVINRVDSFVGVVNSVGVVGAEDLSASRVSTRPVFFLALS